MTATPGPKELTLLDPSLSSGMRQASRAAGATVMLVGLTVLLAIVIVFVGVGVGVGVGDGDVLEPPHAIINAAMAAAARNPQVALFLIRRISA